MEPRKEPADTILYQDLAEVSEVNFFTKGMVKIGFEINNKQQFPLKFKNIIVGDYGCTFNQRTEFIYQTMSVCEGFFIRKRNWKQILQDNKTIAY